MTRATREPPLISVPTSESTIRHVVWDLIGQRVAIFRRPDGKRLAISVSCLDSTYLVIALETVAEGDVDTVLDSHGHQNLGYARSEIAARAKAEKFARKWLKSGKSVEDCACDAIQPRKAKVKRKR